jgi:tetratricopeptide (TPR) repeat protein
MVSKNENTLNTAESLISSIEKLCQRKLGEVQLAKLYGYVEHFQVTMIDSIEVDNDDERSRRRVCARKTNQILDLLGHLGKGQDNNDQNVIPEGESVSPSVICSALVLNYGEHITRRKLAAYALVQNAVLEEDHLNDSEIFYELIKKGNQLSVESCSNIHDRGDTISSLISSVEMCQKLQHIYVDRGLLLKISGNPCTVSIHSIPHFMEVVMTKASLEQQDTNMLLAHTHVSLARAIFTSTSSIVVAATIDNDVTSNDTSTNTNNCLYMFISSTQSQLYFSVIRFEKPYNKIQFEHFSSHDISSNKNDAMNVLRSLFCFRGYLHEAFPSWSNEMNTVFCIGKLTPLILSLKDEMMKIFPSCQWDDKSLVDPEVVVATEGRGATQFGNDHCNTDEQKLHNTHMATPAFLSFGIRSLSNNDSYSKDNEGDAPDLFMPFILSYQNLPISITKKLYPTKSCIMNNEPGSNTLCSFEIMFNDVISSNPTTIWIHNILTTSELLNENGFAIEVKLRVDIKGSLFVSTRVHTKKSTNSTWCDDIQVILTNENNSGIHQSYVNENGEILTSEENIRNIAFIQRCWESPTDASYYKTRGNLALQARGKEITDSFPQQLKLSAYDLYSIGLLWQPTNAILYSNRSASAAMIGSTNLALHDALKCTKLAPQWYKGFAHAGDAYYRLGNSVEALKYYQLALNLETSEAINAKLLAAKELHERQILEEEKAENLAKKQGKSKDAKKEKSTKKKMKDSCQIQ